MSDFLATLDAAIRPYVGYFFSTTGNLIWSLMVFAPLAVVLFLGRHVHIYRRIRTWRRSIPLVVGGWGTRGKSSTERLKAALFSGMGYSVVAKTTGSEAMFIRTLPGRVAEEVFLYRPYDKVSIWEQTRVVRFAARSRAQVYLWECMALNRHYVSTLQRQWMRDDVSTITNAYPDHEDIQGPSGLDVARVIAGFTPDRSTCITAEREMLPVLRETARERRTRMEVVGEDDADLIPRQLLARFPYPEHPANVALVTRLGEVLGIDREQALVEIADNVVPDIGVLRVYAEAEVLGRRVTFANGMSANERAGFMNSWLRIGMDRVGGPSDPGRWVGVLVNNRGDRTHRSRVFAAIVAEDIFVNRAVLIGTNTTGLKRLIAAEARRHVDTKSLMDARELQRDRDLELSRVAARLDRLRAELRLAADGPASLRDMAVRTAGGREPPVTVRELADAWPRWVAAAEGQDLVAIESKIAADPLLARLGAAESLPFLAEHAALHVAADHLFRAFDAAASREGGPTAADARALNELYRSRLYERTLRGVVVLPDPGMSGDAVIHAIARECPPGFAVSVMGMQNIKGTGLDVVYRWLAYEKVRALLARMESADDRVRTAAIRSLIEFDDYGILDSSLALARVEALLGRRTAGWRGQEPALSRLKAVLESRQAAARARMRGSKRFSLWGFLVQGFETQIDFLAGIRRTREARRVAEDLLDARIGQVRAARILRELTRAQKGGWLRPWIDRKLGR